MFGAIAPRYDLANHLLSCGCDFIWRRRAAEIVASWNPQTILDLATGTGDLALKLAKALPNADIVGADFSEEMLALREMARVLGTNGNLLVMEFSLPSVSILRAIYRFYLHRLLPIFGSFLTRKKAAYDYLGDSIEQFPGGEELVRLIEANEFRDAAAEPLTGGIVTIYTATKRI